MPTVFGEHIAIVKSQTWRRCGASGSAVFFFNNDLKLPERKADFGNTYYV
jgi:RNase P/RNase MRP subunit p29